MTEKEQHPYNNAQTAYDGGMPLRVVQRKFKLNKGELRDIAPDEMTPHPTPEGDTSGY